MSDTYYGQYKTNVVSSGIKELMFICSKKNSTNIKDVKKDNLTMTIRIDEDAPLHGVFNSLLVVDGYYTMITSDEGIDAVVDSDAIKIKTIKQVEYKEEKPPKPVVVEKDCDCKDKIKEAEKDGKKDAKKNLMLGIAVGFVIGIVIGVLF